MKKFRTIHFYPLFFVLLFVFTVGCTKDDSSTALDEETLEDPSNTAGRFSEFLSCEIIAVPSTVGLSTYYKKYLNCSGIPVIGSEAVPDEALYAANETLAFMLTGLGSVRAKLIRDGNYIALYPEGGHISDLPEPFLATNENTGAYTWIGSGPNDLRALACDVPSILCYPDGPVGHVLVHEITHMIHVGALRLIESSFESELESIYNQSLASGKWNNTYGTSHHSELLAEAVTIYYGVNWIGPLGGDGLRNEIGTRAQLQDYDPALYNFINNHFNNSTAIPGCREPVISGVTANCPATVTDIDGNVYEVVNIGSRCWMKENLRTTRYRDGSPILNITNNVEWQNATMGAWANYENNTGNDAIYGKLYNGLALKNEKLCPEGWYVPSLREVQDLIQYSGGDYAAANLRSLDLWNPSGITATNSSGFTLLPAGMRISSGSFQHMGYAALIGSKTQTDQRPFTLYSKNVMADQEFIFLGDGDNTLGVSCRCVKEAN